MHEEAAMGRGVGVGGGGGGSGREVVGEEDAVGVDGSRGLAWPEGRGGERDGGERSGGNAGLRGMDRRRPGEQKLASPSP